MRILSVIFFGAVTCFGQDAFIRNQDWCAKKSEANMAATKRDNPEVAATILSYLYEYSPSHHSCVAVMEYKVKQNDGVFAQILARNMVTNQPMKAFAEIYLVPLADKQKRIDAMNTLFEEYSK